MITTYWPFVGKKCYPCPGQLSESRGSFLDSILFWIRNKAKKLTNNFDADLNRCLFRS
jgi:hypothetical protein